MKKIIVFGCGKAASKESEKQDYKSLFMRDASITARSGKTAYISKEHHERITKIVQVIGKNDITLFSYIHNVLEQHFAAYKKDITELYWKNIEQVF